MKKILMAVAALVLTGCAPYEGCNVEKPKPAVVAPAVTGQVLVEKSVPVYAYRQTQVLTMQTCCPHAAPACRCSLPDPCREVQHPRIKEVVTEQPRRNCPVDGQMINCGCGNQKTFDKQPVIYQQINNNEQPMTPQFNTVTSKPQAMNGVVDFSVADKVISREVIPAMPEAYILASNRVVSRFFKDASSVYSQKPHIRLYVKPAVGLSGDLPTGLEKGPENFKRQVANSYTFEIVNNPSDADYYVETTADWFDTPSKSVPAIQYKTVLYDSNNNKVKEWVEIIKKADNSQSWL